MKTNDENIYRLQASMNSLIQSMLDFITTLDLVDDYTLIKIESTKFCDYLWKVIDSLKSAIPQTTQLDNAVYNLASAIYEMQLNTGAACQQVFGGNNN